jgi:hypothetical protein
LDLIRGCWPPVFRKNHAPQYFSAPPRSIQGNRAARYVPHHSRLRLSIAAAISPP